MEIQASRLRARIGPGGEPILLLDQDRSRWDQLLIRHGLAALRQAAAIDGARGPYALQAAIAACHALAPTAAQTDWPLIAGLYAALAQVMPSPVVELNRAVALGMAVGPAAGLELADALMQEAALADRHLLAAVRGDLLEKLGRREEARAEFERAARLTRNARERALMLGRANAIAPTPSPAILWRGASLGSNIVLSVTRLLWGLLGWLNPAPSANGCRKEGDRRQYDLSHSSLRGEAYSALATNGRYGAGYGTSLATL